MSEIRLQFVLGDGLSSRAIAWFGAGHFSHVDAVMPDGRLMGARSDWIGFIPPGVEIRPSFYEPWKERVVMVLEVSHEQEAAFWRFGFAQLGKPYDHSAIWGFATGRDWREDDSWFCSECWTGALEVAHVFPDLYTPRNKVMPGTLAALYSAVGARAEG